MTIRKVKSKKAKDLRLLRCARNDGRNKRGAALLVVLFIVMAITILSLGFLSRSDVELACGENMILRTQMDYLAESGLEHAKGLILSPQDIDTEYWTGAVGQQLIEDSDDYYDVTVSRDDPNLCNYIITCDAYREKNGERIGRSSLEGELRLDPCIAYWVGVSTTVGPRITINGDVYCNGDLTNNGTIGGDAFANGNITNTGSVTGQMYPNNTKPIDVNWPNLSVIGFTSQYYIGSEQYSVGGIATEDLNDIAIGPDAGNPAGIYYRDGNLELKGNVTLTGTLVVKDRLDITGAGNRITAIKNFPAIIIGDHLEIKASEGAGVTVEGLIQSRNGVHIRAGVENALIEIVGGLFTQDRGIRIDNPNFGYMTITSAPAIASIQTWPAADTAQRWGPAAGAFFRSIERK